MPSIHFTYATYRQAYLTVNIIVLQQSAPFCCKLLWVMLRPPIASLLLATRARLQA